MEILKIAGLLICMVCALYAGFQAALGNPAFGLDWWVMMVLVTIGTFLVIDN